MTFFLKKARKDPEGSAPPPLGGHWGGGWGGLGKPTRPAFTLPRDTGGG